MIVVSDTTPLISLMKLGAINLIEGLYGEILIPEAVYNELTCNNKFFEEAKIISESNFIKIVYVENKTEVQMIQKYSGLDLGESEAIAYSQQINADLLMMDEAKGRSVARQVGLTTIGTLGILKHAYDKGLLSKEEAINCVCILRKNHRHIDEGLLMIFLDSLGQ